MSQIIKSLKDMKHAVFTESCRKSSITGNHVAGGNLPPRTPMVLFTKWHTRAPLDALPIRMVNCV